MILPYIINVALILGTCLVFYKLLLRRETFYKVNRYMLITCLAISFALPLLQVPAEFSLRKTSDVKRETSDVNQSVVGSQQPAANNKQPATSTQPVTRNQPATSNQQQATSTQPATGNSAQPSSHSTGVDSSRFSLSKLMTWLFWFYWFGVGLFGISFLFQVVLLLWRAYRNSVI